MGSSMVGSGVMRARYCPYCGWHMDPSNFSTLPLSQYSNCERSELRSVYECSKGAIDYGKGSGLWHGRRRSNGGCENGISGKDLFLLRAEL